MIEIYGSKIRESVSYLERMLIETETLLKQMIYIRETLKKINDDLEADRKAKDSWADSKEAEMMRKQNDAYNALKERAISVGLVCSDEVAQAMEEVENQQNKVGDQRGEVS